MSEAIYRTLIQQEEGYIIPREFGMFSDEGNAAVRAALIKFIKEATRELEGLVFLTPQARLDAFQNIEVVSQHGNTYDDYFGYRDNILSA